MVKQLKIFYLISLIVVFIIAKATASSDPISPSLGSAETFAVLASTYANGVIGTTINGNIGYLGAPAVAPTTTNPPHINDSTYVLAGIDQMSALSALDSQSCTYTFPAGAIELSTAVTYGAPGVYTPGVYCIAAAASITTGMTLSGSGTYIFRITGALTAAASINVILTNGASAGNVWWTPTGSVTLGANSNFIGNAFSNSITLGADVIWVGRTFAFGGTVTTGANSILTAPISIPVDPPVGPPVDPPTIDTSTCTSSLGTANTFGILATALFTGTPTTTINGHIGYTTLGSTPTVNGIAYAAPYISYTSAIADTIVSLDALNSQECDYSNGAAMDLYNDATHYTAPAALGSLNVYTPGVYCITGAISLSGPITLSGSGIYIFKTPAAFTAAAGVEVLLSNGALANNIFWTSLSTTFGANVDFKGSVLATTAITLGADNTINGRLFANAITTAVNSNITVPTYFSPPNISSTKFESGILLPGGVHNLGLGYSDTSCFGINMSSDIMTLFQWNGVGWSSDIASTGLQLGSKIITNTGAIYPSDNLAFGKYRYDFTISDNPGNISSTGSIFYIDRPEMIISTGSLDIGDTSGSGVVFSEGEITVTIKTLGAGFDLILNKSSIMQDLHGNEVINWDGSEGIGYDLSPYSGIINPINTDEILASQASSLNTNGDENTYTYTLKIGNLIDEEQVAGDYQMQLDFGIHLTY